MAEPTAIEDWPALSTQPYGVQADGTVVQLYPPDLPDQLVTIAGGTPPPPVLTLGAGSPITGGTVFPTAGWNLFIDGTTNEPTLYDADGETTEAPDDGVVYLISVT
jgi:hypothetical protein